MSDDKASDKAKVLARIQALMSKTVQNGCTEAEALAAAAMVGKLLEKHNIDMTRESLAKERCVVAEMDHVGFRESAVDYCLTSIAYFCDCKVWLHTVTRESPNGRKEKGYDSVKFFGLPHDVQMACYLYALCGVAIASAAENLKTTAAYAAAKSRKLAYTSFQNGMAARLAARLREMKDESNRNVAAATVNTGNSLVVVKNQLVTEAYAKMNLNLESRNETVKKVDSHFRHRGVEAANTVNLSRPISGYSKTTESDRLSTPALLIGRG